MRVGKGVGQIGILLLVEFAAKRPSPMATLTFDYIDRNVSYTEFPSQRAFKILLYYLMDYLNTFKPVTFADCLLSDVVDM